MEVIAYPCLYYKILSRLISLSQKVKISYRHFWVTRKKDDNTNWQLALININYKS